MFYNVNEFHTLSDEQLRDVTGGKYTIAYWFWELSELPEAYRKEARRVDEIWVASRFVQTSMQSATTMPVKVIPPPVEVGPAAKSRQSFGIPEGRYVFLFNFSAASCNARKNPVGVIRAFEEAFGRVRVDSETGPLLVIKVQHLERFPELQSYLRSEVARVGGLLLEESYTKELMDSLLNVADAYVSLHRAEGFGLGMAESIALGKPVIATAYSGNIDFMTAENSYPVGYVLRQITEQDHEFQPVCATVYRPGQYWAEPDNQQAAVWMQHLYQNPGEGRERGQKAAADIKRLFSRAMTGKRIEERLRQIHQIQKIAQNERRLTK
jgi:glycosyltransferase involved in cell wall biosynthesis